MRSKKVYKQSKEMILRHGTIFVMTQLLIRMALWGESLLIALNFGKIGRIPMSIRPSKNCFSCLQDKSSVSPSWLSSIEDLC